MKINLRILFLLSALILFQKDVFGQGCGTTGGFTVTPVQGCAPQTVQVANAVTGAENVSYAFNFDRTLTAPNPGDITQDVSYTYSNPGTYTILQFGSAAGTGFSQCKDVVVLETRAPAAELITCPSGTARLTILNNEIGKAYDFIEVDWGDGLRQNVTFSGSANLILDHAFSAGNIQTMVVTGKYNAGPCQQNLSTTFSAPFASETLAAVRIRTVEISAAGEAKILYDGLEGIATEILIDKGDGQFVSTGKGGQTAGPQSATVTGLNPNQSYVFKLSSKGICGNAIESDAVSSIVTKEGVFSLDEIISISWEHRPNTGSILQYQVIRDGVVVFVTSDQLSFLDTDVTCGNTYQYQIVAVITNDVRSYSAPISLQPKTASPEVITSASVTVEDAATIKTQVQLSGEGLTSTYSLLVERAGLGSNDFRLISPEANQALDFADTDVNTDAASYCYRFLYKNACNLVSPPSAPVCSILLKNNVQEVSWTPDSPFTAALSSYDLLQTDDAGNLLDQIPKQTSTSHPLNLDAQSAFSFQVKAYSADGNFTSFSNLLNVRREGIVLVPDIFTPNGDAHNERFEVKAYFLNEFSLSVFNRWGAVVFHTDDVAQSWDGNVSTGKAPGGYYLYKITGKDAQGNPFVREGSFLLVR